MTETGDPMRLAAAVRREWLIVVVAALIGLVAAGVMARNETVTRSKATQLVTVTELPGGIPSLTTAEVFVTTATSPTVLHAAEQSLGLKRGSLSGTVSTALATADKHNATISVSAPSKREALRRVQAVSAASVTQALLPYRRYVEIQAAGAKLGEDSAARLKTQIARLEAAAKSAPAAQRSAYYTAIAQATYQLYQMQQAALQVRQEAQSIDASVYVDPTPTVSSASSGGFQIATMLQGLLLGIVAGVIIALVREWLRGRRAAA